MLEIYSGIMLDGLLSQDGYSALMAASAFGRSDTVNMLVKYKAQVNLTEIVRKNIVQSSYTESEEGDPFAYNQT